MGATTVLATLFSTSFITGLSAIAVSVTIAAVAGTTSAFAIDKVKSGKAKGPHGESLPRTAKNFTAKAKQK